MSHRRFWLLLTLVVLLLATLAFASPALAGDAPNPLSPTSDSWRLTGRETVPAASPTTNWAFKAPMSVPRGRLAVVSDGSQIFAIGGEVRTGVDYVPTTLVEAYNPANNTWTTLAPMPTAARNLQGCYMNGKIYLPNGLTGPSSSPVFAPTLWIYTVGSNSWSTGANFPTTAVIFRAVACDAANNKVYLAGGSSGTGSGTTISNKAYVYDATTNAWTQLANLPGNRYGAVGYWRNGLFLVAGGDDNITVPGLTSTLAYNPTTNTWSTFGTLVTDRVHAAGTMLDNDTAIIVGGGFSSAGMLLASTETYSGNGPWTAGDNLNQARRLLGAAAAGGMVCAIGGYNALNGGTDCDADSGLCSANECLQLGPTFNIQVAPASGSVCGPGSVPYTVSVVTSGGYNGNVTLSASGLPLGATVQFSPNPVSAPGASTMTISTSANTPVGDYTITVQGTDGSTTRTATVQLSVNAFAAVPTLLSPANNASSIALTPQLSWTAAANATSYHVQVAEDRYFTTIVAAAGNVAGTSWTVTPPLRIDRTYHWRVRGVNTCGASDWSSSFAFTTQATAPVCSLLVDDDDNDPDLRPMYTTALNALGIAYTVFDVGSGAGNGPTLSAMQPYSNVIWFAGDKVGGNGPNATDEGNLASYLSGGGRLLLSAQDYMKERSAATNFDSSYLGVASYQEVPNSQLNGVIGNPIGGNIGHVVLGSIPNFQNFADALGLSGASSAFVNGVNQSTITSYESGNFKTAFFSTEWARIAAGNASAAQQTLSNAVNWFGGCPNAVPCIPPDVDCSGIVDIVDIILTAQAWNDYTQSGIYEADYDVNSDNVIDILDVMLVTAALGQSD